MDQDASTSTEVLPPIAWQTTRKVGLFGLGLCGAAALLGLVATAIGDPPSILNTLRLALVFVGTVTTGVAISFRPNLLPIWLIGAGAVLLAVFGTPTHWDSFRLLFGVLTSIAVFRAVLCVVSPRIRIATVSVLLLLHFFGILLATTSPSPQPWMVDQLYRRAYEPYLQFVYLRNAYHFYSPEPGPASLMICLVKTHDGKETGADGIQRDKYRTEWIVMPRRPDDVKDPLGVTYYRRLSLTEGIAHGNPDMTGATAFERSGILKRRSTLTIPGSDPYIPLHPTEMEANQYRLPAQVVSRYVLPSYAQHILMELPPEDRVKTTVKIYRVEHRTLTVGAFIGIANPGRKPGNPYYPTTYWPYFMGEFKFAPDPTDPKKEWHIELVDPKAEMLYWLVPIVERPSSDPNKKDYIDYLSVHAGREFEWSKLR